MPSILVVDDEPDIAFLVKVCLVKDGHDVKTVTTKDEFLECLPKFNPDLIILDVMLKGANGRDICREIKAAGFKDIPIILYSANRTMLENFEECQANGTLGKPFNISDLKDIVNKHLYPG